ncbi:sigma-70 family RNA polymerase sigma factor [Pontibacter sp. JH31]|uniref:Sigma-70 family RNA polymerase sigma factor n=1 Tax=Pontibacter aquaedesilientis TaxID=2766980 RepID=A0ABR7XDI9_9BACT|nr:sigma-70 family RNA polymerase sigma factor [Pontibacter aquaedesilientis]MBD1396362.1 sigma-70 family RNA polymerase sigma factor [Pontibacter aquaedesilientis]
MFLKFFSKDRPPDDLELVQQYRRSGDLDVIGKLFERHTDMVYLVCMKYLQDEDESKDATMQVFEQLVTALKKHEVANFKPWLHTLTKNHCLQLLRAQSQRGKLEARHVAAPGIEPGTDLQPSSAEQQELEIQALERGLIALSPEQRTCLELFYLQQKSYKDIVELTGCDMAQVKSYIQNGRRNLKNYMEKHHAQR